MFYKRLAIALQIGLIALFCTLLFRYPKDTLHIPTQENQGKYILESPKFDFKEHIFKNPNISLQHNLWPLPMHYESGNNTIEITSPCNFFFYLLDQEDTPEIQEIFSIYLENIFPSKICASRRTNTHPHITKVPRNNVLFIQIENKIDITPNPNTDESYLLYITEELFILKSKTYVGFLRGIETFSQLIEFSEEHNTPRFYIPKAPIYISDYPKYPYRGLYLDVSSHFVSKGSIMKIIDGLMYTKMNRLHIRFTGTDSFSIESKTRPDLSNYGAFSKKQRYTYEDIKEIEEYANKKGVILIPEISVPTRAGSWAFSPLAKEIVTCIDGNYESSKGQLDPSAQKTYEYLKDIIPEFDKIFKSPYFHLGGTEFDPSCWNSTKIKDFMAENHINSIDELYSYFMERVKENIDDKKAIIYWVEAATPQLKLRDNDVVQFKGIPRNIIKISETYPNTKIIRSDFLELDAGFTSSYVPWSTFYGFDCTKMINNALVHNVIGGEAMHTTEFTGDTGVVGSVFPRVAALGERLWTDPHNLVTSSTVLRLNSWISRVRKRGIKSGPITTGYCEYNVNDCFN